MPLLVLHGRISLPGMAPGPHAAVIAWKALITNDGQWWLQNSSTSAWVRELKFPSLYTVQSCIIFPKNNYSFKLWVVLRDLYCFPRKKCLLLSVYPQGFQKLRNKQSSLLIRHRRYNLHWCGILWTHLLTFKGGCSPSASVVPTPVKTSPEF